MIINNLNIDWSRRSLRPLEANPPLIINADAILALTVVFERFEAVAWQIQIE